MSPVIITDSGTTAFTIVAISTIAAGDSTGITIITIISSEAQPQTQA